MTFVVGLAVVTFGGMCLWSVAYLLVRSLEWMFTRVKEMGRR